MPEYTCMDISLAQRQIFIGSEQQLIVNLLDNEQDI